MFKFECSNNKDNVIENKYDIIKDKDFYIFPAILKEDLFDDNKTIYVTFPDLENCFSDGIDLKDTIKNAKEALGNVIYWMKKEGHSIPTSSDIRDISINEENEMKTLIYVDMNEFKNDWENKYGYIANGCVKRVRSWLDQETYTTIPKIEKNKKR